MHLLKNLVIGAVLNMVDEGTFADTFELKQCKSIGRDRLEMEDEMEERMAAVVQSFRNASRLSMTKRFMTKEIKIELQSSEIVRVSGSR